MVIEIAKKNEASLQECLKMQTDNIVTICYVCLLYFSYPVSSFPYYK